MSLISADPYTKGIIEASFNLDETTGLRGDKTPVKELLTESQVNQSFKEQGNLFIINDLLKHQ